MEIGLEPDEIAIPSVRVSDPTRPRHHDGPDGPSLSIETDGPSLPIETEGPSLPIETVGAYRLVAPLGQGGMGEVYLGWDERLKRKVAIKRIRADRQAKDGSRGRFRREARATAQLSHSAIVQIFDVLEGPGGDCIVMEYIEGRSLAQAIAAGDLDVLTIVRLAGEIAGGLGEAHGKGLVHRDLKPENVMLTSGLRPRAKILDFGLARALYGDALTDNSSDSLTASGAVIGTPYAMSPEQASGRHVDHRSDLFALGNLIYQTLSGEAPFRGENFLDTVRKVVSYEPPPIQTLRSDVPAALGSLVQRLLDKDRSARPASAHVVEAELRRIALDLEAGHVRQEPGSTPEPSMLHRSTMAPDALLEPASVVEPTETQTVVRTLAMVDLVDSTRLVESLGDLRASKVFARHDRMARNLLRRHQGLEIDKSDGFLLLFERPFDAIAFALQYHQALAEPATELDVRLTARAAVHLGEVVLRSNSREDISRGAKPLEVEGLAKPMTARLLSLAGSRQTLLSRAAFDLGRRSAVDEERWDESLHWLAHGPYVFQGVDHEVEVFEVGVDGLAPLAVPPDSDKARRSVAISDEVVLGWRPAAGQTIPRRPHWTLSERLGEGGFGEVWLARHKSSEGRVFKFCFEADKLRGLKREVTLFRLMKHALGHRNDIARVLDWSFDEAPFFLEVEYSEAGSLIDWVERKGGPAEVPLKTRLEIVAQVAEALAAAHSVGVLHKDVKPQNVLIVEDPGGRPRVRLADFGVGRLVDDSVLDVQAFTVTGFSEDLGDSASGTRLYMAPELLLGKPASVQADIYSLGVMLYQLVVGRFDSAVASGWQREVHDDLLREDIAACVDGRADQRPSNAQTVAHRLRTLEARHRQRAEETRAARRLRALRVGAATLAAVLVLTAILAFQEATARRETDRLRAQSDRLRGEAEGMIGFMLDDLQGKLKPIGRLDIVEGAADKALEYFASLEEEDYSSTTLSQYAQALNQAGDFRMARGDLDGAQELFELSMEKTRLLTERDPEDPAWTFDLGQSHFWLGFALRQKGEYDASLREMRRYLEISLELSETDPANTEWLLEVAYAHTGVAELLKYQSGSESLALEHFQKSLEISRRLLDKDPAHYPWRLRWFQGNFKLGIWLIDQGMDLATARSHFEQALNELQELLAERPDDAVLRRQLLTLHNHFGGLLILMGESQQAWQSLQAQRDMCTDMMAIEPENVEWSLLCDVGKAFEGRVLLAQGDASAAVGLFRELSEAAKATGLTTTPAARNRLFAQWGLADSLLRDGETSEAMATAEEALGVAENLLQTGSQEGEVRLYYHRIRFLISNIEEARGRPQQARQIREAIRKDLNDLGDVSNQFIVMDLRIRVELSLGNIDGVKPQVLNLIAKGYREESFLKKCSEYDWDFLSTANVVTTNP